MTVIVDEEYETTTDENGKVSFYARPYSYSKKGNEKHYTVTSLSHSYAVKSGEEDLAKGNFTAVTPNTVIKVEITKTSKNNTINTNRQITTEPQPVTEPATEAPYTPLESVMGKVADEHKIQYAGKLGENIRYTIYKNGYMVIDGYGEMNKSAALKGADNGLTNFSSAEEKSLVKNVVIKDSKADLDQLLTEEYVLNLYIVDNAKDLVKAFNDSDKNEKNDIKYFGSLSSENETILKKYINDNMKYYSSLLDKYKESLLTEAEGQFIANIDDYLFRDCKNLETVVLPANIESIDSFAFSGCTNLKSITYEGSPNAGKKAIDLPPSLKSIGYSAFSGCSSLGGELDLTGNSALEEIGSAAFSGCEGITSVHILGKVKNVEALAFSKCTNLKKAIIEPGVEHIGSSLFSNCTSLEEVSLPFAGYNIEQVNNLTEYNKMISKPYLYDILGTTNGNTTEIKTVNILGGERIPNHFFYNNATDLNRYPNLETINIGESVIYIDSGAFIDCKVQNAITFKGNIKQIASSAFLRCSELKHINFPESVDTLEIESSAFSGCSSLEEITIPEGVKKSPSFKDCSSLKSISLPDTLEELSNDFLFNCTSIESITIPGSVEIIPPTSFRNCQNLKRVILLEGVQQIIGKPDYTKSFYDCDSLSEIYIPKSFTMIGQNSFGVTINDDFGTVYYGGNEEEWEALKATQMKNYYTSKLNGNDSIFNANVIFNTKPEDMSSYVASQEEFVPSGDVNGNGKLDLGDALAILQYIANSSKYPLSEKAIKQADVYNTGDGITPMDALAIQQYDAGLIDSLPVYR